MAKEQFLTILLVVTFFLGDVVSVTDKEFEDLVVFVHQQATVTEEQSTAFKEQSNTVRNLEIMLEQQSETITKQTVLIQQLQDENEIMMRKISRQDVLIQELTNNNVRIDVQNGEENLIQNTTIEERVTLLEIQVTDLDEDVDFLFDETVIQDERIFSLEQTSLGILGELDSMEDEVESLQATTLSLDFRVTTLEENGGSDGNSSVAELEVRVETLEETADDHGTRISTTELDISGLQMTDVELDTRVTALEENVGGGGNNQNDTIAFHAILTSYSTIPDESAVLYDRVLLNEGDGYDSGTGTFTVPPGGDGFYYFSTYLLVRYNEFAYFHVEINGSTVCTAYTDERMSDGSGLASCSAVMYVMEGDTVNVVYTSGTDTTPVWASPTHLVDGFNGFRI